MTTLRAFIFDLDGVLTDTAEFHYKAWKRLADENGLHFTHEDNDQLRGVDRRESLNRLLRINQTTLPDATFEQWMALKNEYYRAYLTEISPNDLLPGVRRFLDEARQAGIRLGVGSASKNARDVLNNLGIMPLLDAIGDGYSVSNAKPAPDLFVWVAGRLDTPPAQTVVFEDAEAGIAAARAGGMFAVGIGPSSRVGQAHLVIPGMADTTPDAIIGQLPPVP